MQIIESLMEEVKALEKELRTKRKVLLLQKQQREARLKMLQESQAVMKEVIAEPRGKAVTEDVNDVVEALIHIPSQDAKIHDEFSAEQAAYGTVEVAPSMVPRSGSLRSHRLLDLFEN